MGTEVGRWSELHGQPEIRDLQRGMDFRHPAVRREVFLRFYEFHLRHKSHPGCVYFLLPDMWGQGDEELRYWIAFLNGNTQNPVTTHLLLQAAPEFPSTPAAFERLQAFFELQYERLEFDTDRRYHKKPFLQSVRAYVEACRPHGGQAAFYRNTTAAGATPQARFELAWRAVRQKLFSFGRLSTWSYLEYLRIAGFDIEPADLMLWDMEGSKSHRNGLSKVLGRDDLDWHKSTGFDGSYTEEQLEWLERESHTLLREAQERIQLPDCNFLTMESAFCTFKSWYRPNRRYPNVYVDMLHDRITKAERKWDHKLDFFWEARERHLPAALLQEKNSLGGLARKKQNWFRETGQVIHMDLMWDCFAHDFVP